ncbi:gem-associated protein 5 [Diretmus argenteus]
MHHRSLPASPNWYCSRCSDVTDSGLLGFGAKNVIYLVDASASSCRVVGELVGHRDLVSSFSFCHHVGQSHVCVSSSTDGTIRFWDSEKKVLLRENASHQHAIAAVHWSPVDKNMVVSGDEKGVVICHWYHTGDIVSFFPEPRKVFCLSCSPHVWNQVAVGYKDGMIVLIDVSRKGAVLHRLRGHDDEIHSLAWAPSAGEDALYSRPEDGPAANGVTEGEKGGCYLASGSKDQTVRIWSTEKGKGVMTLKLPYLKKRGAGADPGVKERLWLSVHWPKGRPTQLVSSCFSGELVMWDLTKTGKQKWTLFGTSSEGQNHSRIVFNMSSVRLQDGRELIFSTSMDREIKCWDLVSLDCCWTLPTLGGFAYALTFSPVAAGCLALGVGDSMIRVWSTLTIQNQYDTRSFWQGIKSKVTALAWHPTREGSLSFGTDDGKVGIYDVFSNKPPQISATYHSKTVYTLSWGPPVPPVSFGASGNKPSFSLYSCGGEGVVLQHDPCQLSGEASDIDRLIRDTNGIKHKLSPHTDLSWKPDGKVVAIGNEDGSVEVYQAPSLKLLCSIQQHHKIINTLRWHHDHGSQAELQFLLASGSTNAKVFIHDLRSIIESPPDGPVVLTEPHRTLSGHTARITDMAWSPHHDARLVTVCYDGTAQVWDVLQEAAVSNYRGHAGHLLCVDWSPVDPDVVWTGGKDSTVQEWSVSKQEFTKPPKGKKMMDKMKTNPKQKKKSRKEAGPEGAPPPSVEIPPRSVNGEGEQVETSAPGEEPSGEEEGASTRSAVPPPELHFLSVKKRKPRALLPLSTCMDHRSKEELLQDCITLATVRNSQAPPAGCIPGQGENIHLGLFSDRQALYRMLEAEEKGHVDAGHPESVMYIRLWSGDLEGALQFATETGELNDHLLSVAPMAGYQVWSRTVEAYVKQLCLQEQYLKAASHLLSINKLYEAVHLLQSHKLYREAIALAKARLPPEEPVLKELYTSWAAVLEKDGHFSSAAKCYLAAGASFDAAKVIARKSDVTSLRTAAGLARISGEADLARSLSLRCAKDLAAAQDWVGAQEVLSTQDDLLVHRLHFCVTELLTVTLAESDVTWSCVSNHPWASPGGRHGSIQDLIRGVWEEEFGVSGSSAAQGVAQALLQDLKALESPQPTANIPLKQVLTYSSLHLTRAVLSWLGEDDGELMKEFWQAVAWPRDAGLLSVSAALCRLLFPNGDVTVCSRKYPKILRHTEERVKAASDSLLAFVHYHRLYESWWSHSASSQTRSSDAGQESVERNSDAGQESAERNSDAGQESAERNSDAGQESAERNSDAGQESAERNSDAGQESAERSSDAGQGSTHERQNGLASSLGDAQAGDVVNDKVVNGESGVCICPATRTGDDERIDFKASVLLCEAQAACQAIHRSIAEIQERLAAMMAQHSQAQGGQPNPGESQAGATQPSSTTTADAGKRPGDQESLLSLSTKMMEYHKKLAELPETVKMYPHPDVVECCLVLLHFGKRSTAVSDSLRREATDLLRKYGTTGSAHKAAQRFLT